MDRVHTGLMVIRAWIEEGSTKPLRAEVRHTSDVSIGFDAEANLTDPDAVVAEVRVFLTNLDMTQSRDR
jgi:hypothetical protein